MLKVESNLLIENTADILRSTVVNCGNNSSYSLMVHSYCGLKDSFRAVIDKTKGISFEGKSLGSLIVNNVVQSYAKGAGNLDVNERVIYIGNSLHEQLGYFSKYDFVIADKKWNIKQKKYFAEFYLKCIDESCGEPVIHMKETNNNYYWKSTLREMSPAFRDLFIMTVRREQHRYKIDESSSSVH